MKDAAAGGRRDPRGPGRGCPIGGPGEPRGSPRGAPLPAPAAARGEGRERGCTAAGLGASAKLPAARTLRRIRGPRSPKEFCCRGRRLQTRCPERQL